MAISDRLQRRVALLLAAASLACAPAPRMGETVHIAEESAIIIWDATAKTQHFIRRASFNTTAKDFGFLVPTPSVPKLDEADNAAFGFLEKLTAPKTVWKWSSDGRESPKTVTTAIAAAEKVRVIETKKVAGYDAAVLEASDANALDNWLKEHGYASSPQLVEWYKPYIAQKWKITAFKISKDGASNRANPPAVKMSFSAERPFFPYREPAAVPAVRSDIYMPPRLLRVFFVGDARYEGNIGATGDWPARTVWSGTMEGKDRGALFKLLKLSDSVSGVASRLTEFEDHSDPRPGADDLFFGKSTDQAALRRPDIIHQVSFGDLIVVLVLAAIVGGILFALWNFFAFVLRFFRSS